MSCGICRMSCGIEFLLNFSVRGARGASGLYIDYIFLLVLTVFFANLSGKPIVTFPEFLKMLAGQKAKPVNIEREILDTFILSDKLKKGYVSRGELEHLLTKGGEGMTKAEGL